MRMMHIKGAGITILQISAGPMCAWINDDPRVLEPSAYQRSKLLMGQFGAGVLKTVVVSDFMKTVQARVNGTPIKL